VLDSQNIFRYNFIKFETSVADYCITGFSVDAIYRKAVQTEFGLELQLYLNSVFKCGVNYKKRKDMLICFAGSFLRFELHLIFCVDFHKNN